MLIDRTRSSAPNAALKRVENVLINQIEVAIEAASSTSLVELNRVIWQGLRAGALSEDDAQRLAEAIHARQALTKTLRKPVGAAGRLVPAFPPRRQQRPPERSKAIERRRHLAASGVMPPALASRFSTSELACLKIVADEVRQRGSCRLFIDAIAARAGTSRSTAKNAMRQARSLGFIEITERRQHGAKSLSNVITIICPTSAPVGQIEGLHERRMAGSS